MENTNNIEKPDEHKMRVPAIVFALVIIFCIGIWMAVKHNTKEHVVVPTPAVSTTTLMQIRNDSRDSVLVYLTLGTTPGCIMNVMNVPFITDSVPGQRGLQGTFILAPGDSTIWYAPDSLGYNGVISFNFAPDNCASPSYTYGINQFEFIINNGFQAGNPQETIDISCVHGVNCVIRVNLNSDSIWNAGPTEHIVQSFANDLNRSLVGLVGVYPYGCDTCTGSKNPPSCIVLPQPKQRHSICNVQRNATASGGKITVIYLAKEVPLK